MDLSLLSIRAIMTEESPGVSRSVMIMPAEGLAKAGRTTGAVSKLPRCGRVEPTGILKEM